MIGDKRFDEKYQKMPSGCWEWNNGRNPKGYGTYWHKGRTRRAHRVAWELVHGPIPKGLIVCHACDNPPCVNPAHLFLGSQEANMQDAKAKNRTANGKKQFCPHGHEYTPENTFYRSGGGRNCRECGRISYRAWYQREPEYHKERLRQHRRKQRAQNAA